MKRFLLAAVLAATVTGPALATDVGVSVSIGQPGFYGRLDIGNYPRPALVYAEPMIIQPVPVGVVARPLYLHVPPGHAKDWRKHCHKYDACGQPVYFVQERWYNETYAPRYRQQVQAYQVGGRSEYRGDDRRGYYDDDDRGKGNGKGHGKGNGNGKGKDRD